MSRLTRTVIAFAFALMGFASVATAETNRSEVETIVRDYLLANPEVIRDALIELQKRDKLAEQKAREEALASSSDVLFNSARQVVLGNPEGSVTMVEFFDYNCGYCKRSYPDMVRLIEEIPDLRVVLKEFPVLGRESEKTAEVAIAVNELAPEKYSDFHQGLMLQRGRSTGENALKVAVDLGLKEDELKKVMASDVVAETISEVYSLATRLGLSGTPAYVIGNEVIPGAVGFDQLKNIITSVKKCGQSSC